MKRKNKILAFTLAEVLITLGIIGIVASLTIPTIIGNAEKQSTVSKVKETYSFLAQATNQIKNDCGGDIGGCMTNSNAGNGNATAKTEITNLYKQKLSVSKDCTDGTTTGCFASAIIKYLGGTDWTGYNIETVCPTYRFTLANGVAIAFNYFGPTAYAPIYFPIYVDINGPKAPNQFGKDFFYFYYDNNTRTLLPLTPDALHVADDCTNTTGNGMTCSSKIIQQGAINYY